MNQETLSLLSRKITKQF